MLMHLGNLVAVMEEVCVHTSRCMKELVAHNPEEKARISGHNPEAHARAVRAASWPPSVALCAS
jgi:hypothetical protein